MCTRVTQTVPERVRENRLRGTATLTDSQREVKQGGLIFWGCGGEWGNELLGRLQANAVRHYRIFKR